MMVSLLKLSIRINHQRVSMCFFQKALSSQCISAVNKNEVIFNFKKNLNDFLID